MGFSNRKPKVLLDESYLLVSYVFREFHPLLCVIAGWK